MTSNRPLIGVQSTTNEVQSTTNWVFVQGQMRPLQGSTEIHHYQERTHRGQNMVNWTVKKQ